MSKNNYSAPSFGYLFIQCAMLFLNYGMEYDMPAWVVWFPSIVMIIILIIVLIILAVAFILGAFS